MNDRLEHLRSLGAPAFDGPAFRFVESLLSRAATLDGPAAERLVRRATTRLDTLEHAFLAAQREAAAVLDQLRAEGVEGADAGHGPPGEHGAAAVPGQEPPGDHATAADAGLMPSADRKDAGLPLSGESGARFTQAFERGDFAFILREGPRLLRQVRSGTADAARERVRRLVHEVERRGLRLDADVAIAAAGCLDEAPSEHRAEPAVRAVGDALAQALYREAAEHARATVVVARAHDRLGEGFGLYNPQALAARALAQLESTSPTFLRAFLASLEDLSALRRLPEVRRR